MSFVTPYDFGRQNQSIKKLKHENRDLFMKYRKYKGLYERSQSHMRSVRKSEKLNTVLEKMNKLRRTNERLKQKIAELEHQRVLHQRFNKNESLFIAKQSPSRSEYSEDEVEERYSDDEISVNSGRKDEIIFDEDDLVQNGDTLTGSMKTALRLQEKRLRHFKAQFQSNVTYLEEQLRKEKERTTRLQKKLNHYSNHVHDLEKHIEKLEDDLTERDELRNSMKDELNESQGNLKELLETVKEKEKEIMKIKTEKMLERSFFGSGLGKELLEQSEDKDLSSSILGDISLLRTDNNNSLLDEVETIKKNEIISFSTHVLVGSDHRDSSKLLEHVVSNRKLCKTFSFSIVNDQMGALQVMRSMKGRKYRCLLYFLCSSEFMNERLFKGLRQLSERVCIVGIKGLCPKKDEIMRMFNDNSFLFFNELEDIIVQFDNVKNSERNVIELRRLMEFLQVDDDVVVDHDDD